MCVVYSNYGIIFLKILSFLKMQVLYLKLYSFFEEKSALRKTELFQFVKNAIPYFVL